MNENGNRYAISALKEQRARLAGEIAHMKKKIAWAGDQLKHIDATLRIFEPTGDPNAIPNMRPRKRVKLFRQGELGRLIFDALRRAGEPITTSAVVTALVAATGNDETARPALAPRVRGNLAYQHGRKAVVKVGDGRETRWALAMDDV